MKEDQLINIRVFITFVVVFGHSIIIFDPRWTAYSPTYPSNFFYMLKELINGFQMQVFFSISGYLFFFSQLKNPRFFMFLSNKFKRLIIPFLLVGVFFMIPVRHLASYSDTQNSGIDSVRQLIVGEDSGHLWFLPTLFGIFIVHYFLLKLKLSGLLGDAFLFLFLFVLSISSPYFTSLLFLENILKWSTYFFLGYLINKHKLKIFRPRLEGFWILCLVLLPAIAFFRYYFNETIFEKVIRVVYSFVCVFVIYKFFPRKSFSWIKFIDQNSYGIYLFHAPIIYVVYNNFSYLQPFSLALYAFLISTGVSLLLTIMIRKLGFKIVLGE